MHTLRHVTQLTTLLALLGLAGIYFSQGNAPAQDEAKTNAKYPQHILIIRHAEKTGAADDVHLSTQGKERAFALPQLFVASKDRPDPFPTPHFKFIFTRPCYQTPPAKIYLTVRLTAFFSRS